MRESLTEMVSSGDGWKQATDLNLSPPDLFSPVSRRFDDLFIALVGEFFDLVRQKDADPTAWSALGRGLSLFASDQHVCDKAGVSRFEAAAMAASAFYMGGFPASAFVTLRAFPISAQASEARRYAYDLLLRPSVLRSEGGGRLSRALMDGNLAAIEEEAKAASLDARKALYEGPGEYAAARMLEAQLRRFALANLRAVLPDGSTPFWTDWVQSAVGRRPPMWEFFPSQIEAIEAGFLVKDEPFSLQMPTGAGKTSICELLVYSELKRNPSATSIMLVPYRSLASELRGSIVSRLSKLGVPSRSVYGGTVPTSGEVDALDDARFLVATPESLGGLLGANPGFYESLKLLIVDEGHLLDGGARGIGLELLVARIRSAKPGLRIVFLSAIVPNIEEVNSWLGGSPESVVKSSYRPADIEFSALRQSGTGAGTSVALEMHAHSGLPASYTLPGFLTARDFRFRNPATGRMKTYGFSSFKTQAVATARKLLRTGAVALYAANKRGQQGAIGLADELAKQLEAPLDLPQPIAFVNEDAIGPAKEYLRLEFGEAWSGYRALKSGAVLHHGDVPQESREVLEALVRAGDVRMVICTSTLAEGVNLPIRALVLYSVSRTGRDGRQTPMMTRDIKNLVGRAGRPGSTTRGLVVGVNPSQWSHIADVAENAPGEELRGALLSLLERLRTLLDANPNATLDNSGLEAAPALHSLVDGVDSLILDLAVEEIGEKELRDTVLAVARDTFAARKATPAVQALLEQLFELRTQRVATVASSGRLTWLRETGARLRLIDPTEEDLLGRIDDWSAVLEPTDDRLLDALLSWSWGRPELRDPLAIGYGRDEDGNHKATYEEFRTLVAAWLQGKRFHEMAALVERPVEDVLRIHGAVVTYQVQSLVEQAIALLACLLSEKGIEASPAVVAFPQHLRYGVPTAEAVELLIAGVRHRTAANVVGSHLAGRGLTGTDLQLAAHDLVVDESFGLDDVVGSLVYWNTKGDIEQILGLD
jgi:hypothetical protein